MKKFINRTIALVFAVVALSSCLKDDSMVLDPDKAGANLVDFVNPTDIVVHGSTTPLYILSYPISTTPTAVPISVSYSGAEDVAPQDVTVNIGVAAQAVIDQYNTEQSKTLNMMPAAWYTLSTTSVVIPKGQKTATFNVVVKTDQIDLTKPYVVPLKLTSPNASVSSNFGTALFQIGAKNKYDGIYSMVSGTVQRYTAGVPNVNDNLNGSMAGNQDLTLTTIDANTVQITNLRWGNNASGVAGIDGLQAIVDPVTNLVTMKSLTTAALLSNTVGKVNKYDPATKTFTLNFNWAPTGNARDISDLQFKYKGPRP